MRKTNTNIKCLRYLKRFILCFVLGHVILVYLFLKCLNGTKPIQIESCKVDVILVEDTEYYHSRDSSCIIYSAGSKYVFPNLGIFTKYSSREFYETIEAGDSLSITYTGKTHHTIVDARDDQEVYLDIESYNLDKKKARVGVLVIFLILEIIFLSILVGNIISNRKMLKRFFQNIYRDKKKNVP